MGNGKHKLRENALDVTAVFGNLSFTTTCVTTINDNPVLRDAGIFPIDKDVKWVNISLSKAQMDVGKAQPQEGLRIRSGEITVRCSTQLTLEPHPLGKKLGN
jgi:hypothetical protein